MAETSSSRTLGVPQLKSAVILTSDVSEGATGFFAEFRGQGEALIQRARVKVRPSLSDDFQAQQFDTAAAQDFLISFDRWCVWDV